MEIMILIIIIIVVNVEDLLDVFCDNWEGLKARTIKITTVFDAFLTLFAPKRFGSMW